MMKFKNILSANLLLVLCLCTSCNGFLDEYSQDLSKVEKWEDLDELILGDGYLKAGRLVPGSYSISSDEIVDNLEFLHFMSDEMIESLSYRHNNYLSHRDKMFAFFTWQQDTGLDKELKYIGNDQTYWDNLYKYINTTNMVIAEIDNQPESKEEDHIGKERVKGEAHFLRAAYYFLLVNLYATPYTPSTASTTPGVPVKLTEYVEDREFPRSSIAEVYSQILSDLSEAETYLKGKTRKSVYRANLTATYLLKSRVYLYMQDWKNAIDYANKTLNEQNSLLYLSSLPAGENAVSKTSPETIFTMGGYAVAYDFADSGTREPAYYVSNEMVSLFNDNDYRKGLYIGEAQYGNTPVFLKYNGQSDNFGSYEDVSDCFLLRTPEAYLTLAEASALSGDEETAKSTLQKFLLSRLKTPITITETGESLVNYIRDERAREFILEGHRWFDLRRYTVSEKYPFSKAIEHGYTYYANSQPDYTNYYVLQPNDDAYTLPIPRGVRSFQVSLGNNDRPDRKPSRTVNY